MVVDDPCPVCHGSGRGKSTKTMQVRIPAGVTDGQRIRLKGRGGAGENGGAAGDLYVTVHVRPHPIFGRKGDNLTLTAPVTFQEAALGAEIEVPTLGGIPVKLRVPQGTPNGRTFRVRGKGVRKRDGSRGDLLVSVEVLVPAALNEQAREALNSYAEAVGSVNPRAKLFAAG
jgi:molecular chaperone DnaJ